jgi:anti-sigma regulatory factor (Ser/Thr protein kinase)
LLLERLAESAGTFAADPGIMEVALPPAPTSAAQARRALAEFCETHAVPAELAELGILAISELVTNVILHARTPTLVWAEYEADTLTVAVTDGETALPALLAPDERREGGRGIALIDHLGASWGLTRSGLGKVVWVTFEGSPRPVASTPVAPTES